MRASLAVLALAAFTDSCLAWRGFDGFDHPADGGGSTLTTAPNTGGLGEPLNVIISGHSHAPVLMDQLRDGGFRCLMLAANMAQECMGLHRGGPQLADLGDGRGAMAEVHELRWDFGHPLTGSCKESLVGGNHLRYYRQEHTGAYFLAVSAEKDLSHHHDIIENGYNLGRDYLVGNFTGKEVDTKNLKPGTVVEGSATFMGWTFHTRAEYVDGLLEKTSDGVNHAKTVAPEGTALDGLVAVLTIKVSGSSALKAALPWILIVVLLGIALSVPTSRHEILKASNWAFHEVRSLPLVRDLPLIRDMPGPRGAHRLPVEMD